MKRMLVAASLSGLAAAGAASAHGLSPWTAVAGAAAVTGCAFAAGSKSTPPPAEGPAPSPLAELRHDIRGFLSPALLVADRLIAHADPGVQKAGNTVVHAIERVTERLEQARTG